MKAPREIIVRPLITEKGNLLKERGNQYLFKVDRRANKIEIKRAIEEIFGVHITSVKTIRMPGKKKRMGRFEGRRPDWKKAVVTVREGESIELFEGV
ncbi:MAG: 50S ribosomal protein L23 [candidate division Zixibacteria bacterium SM23_81]|nr:MAG: 50S ribosomal protein L23 [candidate division Zixibacteria bacterium SM23_81]